MALERPLHDIPAAPQRRAADEKLVRATLSGCDEAFDVLVDRYRRRIVQYAYRYSHNEQDANDAAQDTLLRAYRSLGTFRADRPFSRWLFVIARNVSLDAVRRKRLSERTTSLVRMEALSEPDTAEVVLRREAASRVRAALGVLPQRQRAALELYYIKGLRYRDIADMLDIPLGTVKTYIARAKRRLRTELGSEPLPAAA